MTQRLLGPHSSLLQGPCMYGASVHVATCTTTADSCRGQHPASLHAGRPPVGREPPPSTYWHPHLLCKSATSTSEVTTQVQYECQETASWSGTALMQCLRYSLVCPLTGTQLAVAAQIVIMPADTGRHFVRQNQRHGGLHNLSFLR